MLAFYVVGSLPAPALSFSYVDIGDAFQIINDISQGRTNRSEWCSGKALAFKAICRGFVPRQRCLFQT